MIATSITQSVRIFAVWGSPSPTVVLIPRHLKTLNNLTECVPMIYATKVWSKPSRSLSDFLFLLRHRPDSDIQDLTECSLYGAQSRHPPETPWVCLAAFF